MKTINFFRNELPKFELTQKNVLSNITDNINHLKQDSKYNRIRIFKRAAYLLKTKGLTRSEALKQSWADSKAFVSKIRSELKAAIGKLADKYIPKQYHEIGIGLQEKINNDMMVSFNNGAIMN